MRFSRKQTLLLGMLAIAVFIVGGFYLYTRPGQASLTLNLPQNDGAATPVFAQRVRKHFSAVASEDAMKAELAKEGFETSALGDGTRIATYSRHRQHCDVTWTIQWDANAKGQIFRIESAQKSECSR